MSDVTAAVRAHLTGHFARRGITAEPVAASVTFLGAEAIDVLRFGPDSGEVYHYVSVGCSRNPMVDPMAMVTDSGPRAEVVVSLRGSTPTGLARSIAILASSPLVEGLVMEPDALIDLQGALWRDTPFNAFLLGVGDIGELSGPGHEPVRFLSATPITATEAAWVRLKGADAMREAWQQDDVDVFDQRRPAAEPN